MNDRIHRTIKIVLADLVIVRDDWKAENISDL